MKMINELPGLNKTVFFVPNKTTRPAKKVLLLLITIVALLPFGATAQNCCDIDEEVDLCYLSGADYCGSNTGFCFGYSLDGEFMVNGLAAKLTSPSNFGPNGIVDCNLELKELEDASSVEAINDCGCDIIFLPNVFIEPGTNTMDLSQSFIPDPILQNVYDWSLQCENNLVIATQGEANLWGYTTTNSNSNPNTPVPGTSLNSIFEGPFGSLDFFNQGGSFQGVFTGTPSTDYEILAYDANNNPTVVLDLVSNDIVVGDIGIFCSGGAGVVSAGAGINNNNDILICNIFGLACELAQEVNKVTVTHELCPGESVFLPDGQEVNSAGIYIDTLVAFNGCDSIVTTSLAYGIEESPIFPEPDTTICQGDTIAVDGTLPIDFPIPYFENSTDIVIEPIFVNVVSEIPVTGFGSTILGPGMIESVCFDIDHTWLDDLDIILIAPNGEYLELTTDNGLNQDNYVGTCLTETATQVIGSPGTGAPFTGDYLPEGDWSDIYGSEINGVWQLVIKDDANGFQGTLLNWSITFAPVLEIHYSWETGTGLSCVDCPIPDAFPDESTTYYLTMTDSYGCSTSDSTFIEVIPSLPAPDVTCDSITLSSININWEEIAGATGYQINIDNMGWLPPNDGNLGYFLEGLSPLDTVHIQVQAFDECGGQITDLTCSTPDCDAPFPDLEAFTAASCFGNDDGSLSLSASGGSGSGYTFELSGELNTTGDFAGLAAGIHEVLVTDDANCGIFYAVEIPQPDSIVLEAVYENDISCFGFDDGSITVEVTNGLTPLDFTWNGSAGDSILTNVTQGDYEVVITNANGCTASMMIPVSEPTELVISTDSNPVDCFGNATGSASVMASGGTEPYNYTWDSGTGDQTAVTAIDLLAGNYSISVVDANNCLTESTAAVIQPTELTGTIDFSDPLCNNAEDGTITVTPDGGTPGYTYNWSGGLANSNSFNDLSSGSYSVTILDGNDCPFELSATLDNPAPIAIVAQHEDVSCFDGNNGSITLNITGTVGSPVFNWDNGASTQNLTNINSGNYCITITDGNNCEATDCVNVDQPTALQASINPQNISCDETDDGSINLTISGGTGPYSFDWSNGSSDEDLSNLTVGVYNVTITDQNDCEIFSSAELFENIPLFSLSFDPVPVICFGESTGGVNLNINGSTSDLTYSWYGPNNFTASSEDLENVPEGNYTVIAEDAFGCEIEGQVTVTQPEPISNEIEITDVSCFGAQDGNVAMITHGGTAPYQYSVNGGSDYTSAALITNLDGGDYQVIIQDGNGCEIYEAFSIFEPEELVIHVESAIEIILGQTHNYDVSLNLPAVSIDTIIWTPTDSLSCVNCFTPSSDPEYSTDYSIQVITEDGCIAQAFTSIFVDRRISVYVPNIFSPNGDGINDVLTVYAAETNINRIKSFQIYDRWGANVFYVEDFQPNDETVGWDGKFRGQYLNSGVFVWMTEIELSDGQVEIFKGDVIIAR